ncbi:hypothetical protein I3843_10G000100 [Carya illinoinensis]|nr:hypothetical protein I3843_10G000100 [Carya illinoinensis]
MTSVKTSYVIVARMQQLHGQEEILGCTAVDLIDRTDEEHLPYIENIANNIENNEWIIVLGAQMNESGKLRQNKLTVLSVNNVPGTAE